MGNPAESLQQVRTQLNQNRTASPALLRSSPRSSAEVRVAADNIDLRPASDSIAAVRALFTAKHCRNQVKLAYESLSDRQRGMVCIAGGLPPHDFSRHFDSFDDLERQRVRRGLQELNAINRRFENSIGNLKNLKPGTFY